MEVYDRARAKESTANVLQSRTHGKPALFNRRQSTGNIGNRMEKLAGRMLEFRSRQPSLIERLLGLVLSSTMSEMTPLHLDDREIVVG